jgi:hypothetical protein
MAILRCQSVTLRVLIDSLALEWMLRFALSFRRCKLITRLLLVPIYDLVTMKLWRYCSALAGELKSSRLNEEQRLSTLNLMEEYMASNPL